MADSETNTGNQSKYTPDFDILRRDVVHEENWPEYEAQGFISLGDLHERRLDMMRNVFGTEHVYTGDAWDEEELRPLRHKPGRSIYVSLEGRKLAAEKSREEEIKAGHHHRGQSGDGPAAS